MVVLRPAPEESPARDAVIIGSHGSRAILMHAGRMVLKPTVIQPWLSTSLPEFHASFTPLKKRVNPDISYRFYYGGAIRHVYSVALVRSP